MGHSRAQPPRLWAMAEPPGLLHRRQLNLAISDPGASQARMRAYLAEVDRPLTALLARERLTTVAPGEFTYHSNPHSVLQWQVVPTLSLRARWEGEKLAVRSTSCRLVGLGFGMDSIGFTLVAVLGAGDTGLGGWAEVGLHSRLVNSSIGRRLSAMALEAVLDRIERRVGRGLRNDLGIWLGGGKF